MSYYPFIFRVHVVLLVLFCNFSCAEEKKELLPGVTYFETGGKLSGRLVFWVGGGEMTGNQSNTKACAIYEFDLKTERLRTVAPTPNPSSFFSSANGTVFCITYESKNYYPKSATNIFVVLDTRKETRELQIEAPPDNIVVLDDHVLCEVSIHSKHVIYDYDMVKNERKYVALPHASAWEYQDYSDTHQYYDHSRELGFRYQASGKKLADGKDYAIGYYSLDVRDGVFNFIGTLDDDYLTFKSDQGQYIFFEGQEAPYHGLRLVSSPLNYLPTKRRDPKGKNVKLLHAFSRLSALSAKVYTLEQMSPDRRFALIREAEGITATKSGESGWINTYYAIEVSNGVMRTLIKEDVGLKTKNHASHIQWVEGVPSN